MHRPPHEAVSGIARTLQAHIWEVARLPLAPAATELAALDRGAVCHWYTEPISPL